MQNADLRLFGMVQAARPIDDNVVGRLVQLDSSCNGCSSIFLHHTQHVSRFTASIIMC